MHDAAWFLTLTYANERIPNHGSLSPPDLRRFFKALRRSEPPRSVSYYACGEYGDQTQRPHYHAVLFGPQFLDRVHLRDSPTSPVWRSPSLESHWPHGLCEFGTVTSASAAYVAGYVRKKVSRKTNPEAYDRLDPETGEIVRIEQEFSRMSRRPALGRRWIRKFWRDVYPRDFVVMDGKEFRPPRYYDKWMQQQHDADECPRGCLAHQSTFYDVLVKRDAEDPAEMDEYQLQAKEAIHRDRVALFNPRSAI
jgi:hypothetical protein